MGRNIVNDRGSRFLGWAAMVAVVGALTVMLLPTWPVEWMSFEPHHMGVMYEPWWTSGTRSKDGWWVTERAWQYARFMPVVSLALTVVGTGFLVTALCVKRGGWTAAGLFGLAAVAAMVGLTAEESPTGWAWACAMALALASVWAGLSALMSLLFRNATAPARR